MRTRGLAAAGLFFALLCIPALAQPARHLEADPSRGTVLPPTTVALTDQAPGVLVNPAALSQVRAFELYYLYTRNEALTENTHAFYAADRFGGFLGLGAGVEWVRPQAEGAFQARRRTTFGLSLGSEQFSLGATTGSFGATRNAFLDRTRTWDLGLLARPGRAVSFGATVRNVNDPDETLPPELVGVRAPYSMPRTWAASVGLRPFGDRLTGAVEYAAVQRAGMGNGRFTYLLEGEPYRGVRLGAGFSHGIGEGPADAALQVGLTLDFRNLGATVAHSAAGDRGTAQVLQLRASATEFRSVSRPRGRLATIDLAEVLSGSDSTLSLLGVREADGFTRLTRILARAERDPAIDGLLVRIEGLPGIGMGKAEELRQALLSVRAAGKRVVAVVFNAADSDYLVASAADQIVLLPQSMLMVDGIAANVTFFGGAMEKLGVQWDVARVGAYKNAPDQFTRQDMSAEQRETMEAWLDVEFNHLVSTLAQARSVPEERIREAMREALITPNRAKELGLADAVVDPAGLEDWVRENLFGATLAEKYEPFGPVRGEWGRRKRVTVIPVIGNIAGGKSRDEGLGFAQIAGAETVVKALEEAADDPKVAAIVMRIDSGGGDALASDLMYRAVLAAKKKKPVVASMGDVAASGGYYAAMGANEIWAAPTTLTGSIGIFFMKPALGGLANKLGIRNETLQRGELSNLLSGFDPWTEAEQRAAQKWVDAFYKDFITEVGASRNLPVEKVDDIARGRVWSGADAKRIGLVDQLGSFGEALRSARRLGGIAEWEDLELEIAGEPSSMFNSLGRVEAKLGVAPPAVLLRPLDALDPATGAALRELGVAPSVLFEPGLKAMLPFGVRAR